MICRASVLTALFVTLSIGCDEHEPAVAPGAPAIVKGEITAFGRIDHSGTTITALPGGRQFTTAVAGEFAIQGTLGGELRIERPGFATRYMPTTRNFRLDLYRGRSFELPEGFVVAESRALPPRSLLVWDAAGAGLLLDLEAGEVTLELPAGWTPTTDLDGWVVPYDDELAGSVDSLGVEPSDGATVRGWTPHGAVSRDGRRALLLARPWPDDAVHLQVALWEPEGTLRRSNRPVRAIGPRIRSNGRVDTTLLTDGGVWIWGLGGEVRIARLPTSDARATEFLHIDGVVGERVCYRIEGRVECADRAGPQEVARIGGADLALLSDGALSWRTAGNCFVQLVGGVAAGPLPCTDAELPAWRSGDAVVVWADDRSVHRVSPRGGWALGRSEALAVSETGVVGLMTRGALTVMQPDGRRRVGPRLEGETALFAAAHGVLAHAEDQLVFLGTEGGAVRFTLDPEDTAVLESVDRVLTDRDSVLLVGDRGAVRVDLLGRELHRVDHVGGTWVGFARLAGDLPDVGLVRVDDGYFAVDLWTGRRDPLGAGQLGGVVGRRTWLADGDRLYIADDPGAMPVDR